jgi:hypothetical protein
VSRLLVEPKQKPTLFVGIRAYEWQLIELSEIPFTGSSKKIQNRINLLIDKTYTPECFSLTGNREGLLSCHNAIITTLLLKLGYNEENKIRSGINWILNYQSMEREVDCK